jgi:hypothetical protein
MAVSTVTETIITESGSRVRKSAAFFLHISSGKPCQLMSRIGAFHRTTKRPRLGSGANPRSKVANPTSPNSTIAVKSMNG